MSSQGPSSITRPASGALPRAVIRTTPADFVVEEIPAYEPSGVGEHLFVKFRKTGLTTLDAVRDLARALGVAPRDAGYAGMKDRHAVTTQWASFPFARGREEGEAVALQLRGIEILDARRHGNKLKTGHLRGNRFRLELRALEAAEASSVAEALTRLSLHGVPNAFGAQRFGRGGANVARALGWMRGEWPGPRDPRKRRLEFSAVQAEVFNRVLAARVADHSFARLEPGDIARRGELGGVVRVPLEDASELARLAADDELCPTGPLPGAKMPWAEGRIGELERAVAHEVAADPTLFEAHPKLGEGTRRPLRLWVRALECSVHDDGLSVAFVLPKGGYATTVLAHACTVEDPNVPRTAAGEGGEREPEPTD